MSPFDIEYEFWLNVPDFRDVSFEFCERVAQEAGWERWCELIVNIAKDVIEEDNGPI